MAKRKIRSENDVSNPQDSSERLRNVNHRELVVWISDLLHGGDWPLPFAFGRETPVEAIVELYRSADGKPLKRKIKDAIVKLFHEIDLFDEDPEVLADVFTIVGALEVRDLYDDILRIANTADFKLLPIRNRSFDLHKFVLAAIVAMGSKRSSVDLFQRDIYDPQYFSLCFQALWEWNLRYAIEYTRPIILHVDTNPAYISDLIISLDTFLRTAGLEYIASQYIPRVLPTLQDPRGLFPIFSRSLKACGFTLWFDNEFFYVDDTERKKYSTGYSQKAIPRYFIEAELRESLSPVTNKEISLSEALRNIETAFYYGSEENDSTE